MGRIVRPDPECTPILSSSLVKAEAERDEADRRAGAAERQMEYLKDTASRRDAWMSRAKRDAEYDDNVSFDQVWEEALKALRARDLINQGAGK